MRYDIYQMPPSNEHKFFSYEDDIKLKDYVHVYTGEIDECKNEMILCDKIYELLNINHPKDYFAHSLSVSDVIQIGKNYYYVEVFGFRKLDWD